MQRLKFLERKLDKNNLQATVYQSEITKLWGKKKDMLQKLKTYKCLAQRNCGFYHILQSQQTE